MDSFQERRDGLRIAIAVAVILAFIVLAVLLLYPHTYDIEHNEGGTVEPDGSVSISILETLIKGYDCTITATPDEGMTVQLLYDGQTVEGNTYRPCPCIFDFSTHLITAIFESTATIEVDIEVTVDVVSSTSLANIDDEGNPLTFGALTATQQFFTVDPIGKVTLHKGDDLTIHITCHDEGCWIQYIKVDGKDIQVTDITHMDVLIQNVTENIGVDVGIQRYPMVSPSIDHGSIYPESPMLIRPGESLMVFFEPQEGYTIVSIVVDGQRVEAEDSYLFKNIREDHTIAVRTTENLILNVSAGTNGVISPSGEIIVQRGESITFTITPASGYVLDQFLIDGKAVTVSGNTYTLQNITEGHTIRATFKSSSPTPPGPTPPGPTPTTYYTLTVTQPQHATITPSTGSIEKGRTVQVSVTPDEGYMVTGIVLDGITVTSQSTYSFTMNADHTITAIIAQEKVSITVFERNGSAVTPQTPLSEYVFQIINWKPTDTDTVKIRITNGTQYTLGSYLQLISAQEQPLSDDFRKQIQVDVDGTYSDTLYNIQSTPLDIGSIASGSNVEHTITLTFVDSADNNKVKGQSGDFILMVMTEQVTA